VFLTGQEEIESVVKSIRDISRDLPSGLHAASLFIVSMLKCVIYDSSWNRSSDYSFYNFYCYGFLFI